MYIFQIKNFFRSISLVLALKTNVIFFSGEIQSTIDIQWIEMTLFSKI